jgi:hypothetical protein
VKVGQPQETTRLFVCKAVTGGNALRSCLLIVDFRRHRGIPVCRARPLVFAVRGVGLGPAPLRDPFLGLRPTVSRHSKPHLVMLATLFRARVNIALGVLRDTELLSANMDCATKGRVSRNASCPLHAKCFTHLVSTPLSKLQLTLEHTEHTSGQY